VNQCRSDSDQKNKKGNERQLKLSKVNVNNVYNKTENYMPINFQPSNKNTCSESLAQKNLQRFQKILEDDATINFDILRKASWQGIPQGIFSF